MTSHPSLARLEAYFVGEVDRDVEAHVSTCERCQTYLDTLAQDRRAFLAEEPASAFLMRPAVQAALTAPESPSIEGWGALGGLFRRLLGEQGRWWAAAATATAALVAVGLSVQLFTEPDDPVNANAIRLKGTVMPHVWVTVTRQRAGRVTEHFGQVSILPGDRLQIEIQTATERSLSAGILDDRGLWMPLVTDNRFPVGRHALGEHALLVDETPTAGWLLVGAPAAVARLRASGGRGLSVAPPGVFGCRIQVEDAL